MKETIEVTCKDCDGEGYWLYSCCGIDMKDFINVSDLCPQCLEHQGEPEKTVCCTCNGTGLSSLVLDRKRGDKKKLVKISYTVTDRFIIEQVNIEKSLLKSIRYKVRGKILAANFKTKREAEDFIFFKGYRVYLEQLKLF